MANPLKRRRKSDKQVFDNAETQKLLEEANVYQLKINEMYKEFDEQALLLEQIYFQQQTPGFDKRAIVISNIPNFWPTALFSHRRLRALIVQREMDCMSYFNKLEVEEFGPCHDIVVGYRIRFFFDENPYFENKVLSKILLFEKTGRRSVYTKIKWKRGMRLVSRIVPSPLQRRRNFQFNGLSFFQWFRCRMDPVLDLVAHIIKDRFWIDPVRYFKRAEYIYGKRV